jgi:hypothetical protein
MGDVIEFRQKDDLLGCCYGVDDKDNFSVVMNDCSIRIQKINTDVLQVEAFGSTQTYTRQELAEFLHVASIFVDEEAKWLPDVDLVAMDY